MLKNILNSKLFWLVVVIILIICAAFNLGRNSTHVVTQEEVQKSIQDCQRWGGQPIYDASSHYLDCSNNGEAPHD